MPEPITPQSAVQKMCRERIQEKQRHIEYLKSEINEIARTYILDFHFLDYTVSTFWTCDDSPIGLCVFKLDGSGRKQGCRYCGGPEERK